MHKTPIYSIGLGCQKGAYDALIQYKRRIPGLYGIRFGGSFFVHMGLSLLLPADMIASFSFPGRWDKVNRAQLPRLYRKREKKDQDQKNSRNWDGGRYGTACGNSLWESCQR